MREESENTKEKETVAEGRIDNGVRKGGCDCKRKRIDVFVVVRQKETACARDKG